MRLARVLIDDEARPAIALERDGALYDVAELDRIFDTPLSPDRMPGASDFHVRACALRCAGLAELDARLLAGERPSGARILPGTFAWLPPCDTDRALYFQLAPEGVSTEETLHRFGDARGLLGNGSLVPYPREDDRAVVQLTLGVVLAETIHVASRDEAERAIVGVALLDAWSRASRPERAWESRRVPAQLGPLLVSLDELRSLGSMPAQIRVGGQVARTLAFGDPCAAIVASVAALSACAELRPGDVVGMSTAAVARLEVPFGTTVELQALRLGKLEGTALRGQPGRE